MKKPLKIALAGLCTAALALGSALAGVSYATRTLEAQFPGIQVKINGQAAVLTDSKGDPTEPFVVDGTTYVPVRALGEALGKAVEWDKETLTISVGKAPLVEDAEQLIATIESTHPAFALGNLPAGYEAAKEALLATASDPDCDTYAFAWAGLAYTASLGDGHTALDLFGSSPQTLLDVSWTAVGDKLFLADENGAPTDMEVAAVGGLGTPALFAAVDRYFPWENEAGRDWNHAYWGAAYNLLGVAGASVGEDYAVVLTLNENGKESTQTVYPAQAAAPANLPAATYETMGDVFYVDLNRCELSPEVDAAAAALAQAVKGGVSKVILDVRGNGGGNSEACAQLLAAMDMERPQYGIYARYSPLAQADRGYDRAEGGERVAPDPSTAKQNPAVKLVVLTDEGTYSSATMLGVWVQDGGLGAVVGRPSANAPNSYGDILYYSLGNSGIVGSVSHKQWLRPDTAADPHTLAPDLPTAPGEDILAAALAFLK